MRSAKLVLSILIITMVVSCSEDDGPTAPAAPPDPCDGVTCLNGGYCVNGECSCPVGYSGPDCGTVLTPVTMKITKIVVTKFPASMADGSGWDNFDGPDVYPKVELNDVEIFKSPMYFDDVAPGTVLTYTQGFPVTLDHPTQEYTIVLWDYDSLNDDDMIGGYNFTPFGGTSHPATLQLGSANDDIQMTLHVTYVF
jgi:hypothetical protein